MAASSGTNKDGKVRAKIVRLAEGVVTLAVPGTEWEIDFELADGAGNGLQAGAIATGVVRAQAQRADVITGGGKYVEPVYGRPRRLQGRILAGDPAANTIVVDCGLAVHCTLMSPQRTADFMGGQMVCFDIEPGASFEPAD